MKSVELLHQLISHEMAEAEVKHQLLGGLLSEPEPKLVVKKFEGSYVSHSTSDSGLLAPFSLARIQEISAKGLLSAHEYMMDLKKKFVLALAPLGIEAEAYNSLRKLQYAIFNTRSIMYCDISKLDNNPSFQELAESPHTYDLRHGSADDTLAGAYEVLASNAAITELEFEQNYKFWLQHNDQAEIYSLRIDRKVAAIGMFSWRGKSGILSSAVVAPEFRGRGLQKRLIIERLHRAKSLGLMWVYAPSVPPFSASETSLRRCGLEVLCNRSFWKI